MSSAETDTFSTVTGESVGYTVPPPVLFTGSLLAGFLLQRLFPLNVAARGPARVLGIGLAIAGLGLMASSVREMRRAGTSPEPNRPTTALVSSGPYRYSRNPIYIAMALLYAGISAIANAVWPLLLLPATLVVLTRTMIEREERYLEGRFGESYRAYRGRVGRWLQAGPAMMPWWTMSS